MSFGMQWHQPDHMQTICTSLQTDNHTNTLSLITLLHNSFLPSFLCAEVGSSREHWHLTVDTAMLKKSMP